MPFRNIGIFYMIEPLFEELRRVFPIDIGPRGGGNMIPDLLGDIFSVDIPAMCGTGRHGGADPGGPPQARWLLCNV